MRTMKLRPTIARERSSLSSSPSASKNNAAVYDVIQRGIHFDWQQDNAERLAGGDPGKIDSELHDAFNEHQLGIGFLPQDINEGRALDALMAANMAGGPDRIRAAVAAAGVDVVAIMNSLSAGRCRAAPVSGSDCRSP